VLVVREERGISNITYIAYHSPLMKMSQAVIFRSSERTCLGFSRLLSVVDPEGSQGAMPPKS